MKRIISLLLLTILLTLGGVSAQNKSASTNRGVSSNPPLSLTLPNKPGDVRFMVMGDTGTGAVSVTAPEPEPDGVGDGAVGPTGTCRVGLDPLPQAIANVETRRTGNSRINRSVVIYRPLYSNNNELTVNLFIENRCVR